MKYKKSAIMLALVIFLFAIATVSASDMDDNPLASEDTNQVELSTDKIIEDNLKTNDEDTTPTQSGNDEKASAKEELDVLSEGEGTYSELKTEIGNGGNKNLTQAYYRYTAGDPDTIKITTSGVIDGKGAIN